MLRCISEVGRKDNTKLRIWDNSLILIEFWQRIGRAKIMLKSVISIHTAEDGRGPPGRPSGEPDPTNR